MNSKVSALMLVKNEEQWIWYAICSVLPYVSEMIVFDSGSTDHTVRIVKSINSKKISFTKKGVQSRTALVGLRNEMVERVRNRWFLLVDGDEVWPKQAMIRLIAAINQAEPSIWAMVLTTRNCVGDIFHYQEEVAGHYQLLGKQGHFTIRAFRKQADFHWQGKYPLEYYANNKGVAIQQLPEHLRLVDTAYWHLTHLPRSSRSAEVIDREKKRKKEIGIPAKKSEIPEIFFSKRPDFVPTPFIRLSNIEKLQAKFITPLKKIKRRIIG